MTFIRIKSQRKACAAIAFATIGLLPVMGFAKSKPILTTDLLKNLLPGEPWDRGVLFAQKMVMFNKTSGVATTISKITLSYFTSTDCSGTGAGSNPGSTPLPSYTTPNGKSFPIVTGTPFGLVATSAWNVGSTQLSIADMTTIQSVAVTLKSTNNNTPQANFSGFSFACVPVTCTAAPPGQCTSASGTQSFQLKTTAAIGDPANGGVIACLGGGLNNLVAGRLDSAQAFSPGIGIVWGGSGTAIGGTAQSNTNGTTNTAAIVTALGGNGGTPYAAQLCQAYATTVVTGGYNTWFLPAKTQLNCLYTNRVAIGNFGLVTNPYYWSSTEFAGVPTDIAWGQAFDNGFQGSVGKNLTLGARCVQAFTP